MQPELHALLGPDRATPSALKIFARAADAEVLIVHGGLQDVCIIAGERLAWVDWYESDDAAERISRQCSKYLCEAGRPPDLQGWHGYSVQHLKTLVRAAQNLLNIKPIPAPDYVLPERQAWTAERDAQLCFLAGRGFTAKAIADDPLVRSTESRVFKRAQRLGIALSAVSAGQLIIRRLPVATLAAIDRGAEAAQLTREAYASRLLIAAA